MGDGEADRRARFAKVREELRNDPVAFARYVAESRGMKPLSPAHQAIIDKIMKDPRPLRIIPRPFGLERLTAFLVHRLNGLKGWNHPETFEPAVYDEATGIMRGKVNINTDPHEWMDVDGIDWSELAPIDPRVDTVPVKPPQRFLPDYVADTINGFPIGSKE